MASVDDHVSMEDPLVLTVVGLALKFTVGKGGGATVTVTDPPAPPPGPVQVKVKVLVAFKDAFISLPEVALVPDQSPEAAHESTFVDDQVNVVESL
ncbi:MAG: hypothetical protein ACE5H7_11810 [Acidiferrobacterales bacterium]